MTIHIRNAVIALLFAGGAEAQSKAQTETLVLGAGQAIGIVAKPQMGLLRGSIAFEMVTGEPLRQIIRGMTMVAPIEA